MKKSLKAALLSGVLGAGAGHLYLKRYRRGAILIVSTLSTLVVIATQAVKQAQVIFGKITPEGGEAMNFDDISSLVAQNSTNEELLLTNGATMLMMLIWTFGVFDAYKIGKDMDNNEKKSP